MQLLGFQNHSFSMKAHDRKHPGRQNIHEAKVKKKPQAHPGLLGGSLESETQTKTCRLETEIPRVIKGRESALRDLHEVKLPSLTRVSLTAQVRNPPDNSKLNFQLSCPHSLLPCSHPVLLCPFLSPISVFSINLYRKFNGLD